MSRIARSRNQPENNIYVFIFRYLYLYIYTLDIFSEVHLDFLSPNISQNENTPVLFLHITHIAIYIDIYILTSFLC